MKNPSEEFNSMKAEDKKALEYLIQKKFPKKALELTALLNKDQFRANFDVFEELNVSRFPTSDCSDDNDQVSASKRQRLNDSTPENELEKCPKVFDLKDSEPKIIHTNRHLVELMNLVRPLMDEFIDDVVKVNVGASLMVPQIEDGNNFGVEVQQDVIEAVKTACQEIYNRMDDLHKFCYARAMLIKDFIKYPKVEDYRRAVHEKDQTFHRFLRMCVILARNNYLYLNDMVEKNLAKLKKPKSSSKSDMY